MSIYSIGTTPQAQKDKLNDSSVQHDFTNKLSQSGRNSAEKATILVASLPFLEVIAFCCLCDFSIINLGYSINKYTPPAEDGFGVLPPRQ